MRFGILLLFFFFNNCTKSTSQEWDRSRLTIYDSFEELEPLFEKSNDTTYLVNFWATWCKPCVEELPYFEETYRKHKNQKFKSILVSLDFKKKIDSKLIPFLNKHKIESDVILLLDGKAHKWIDKVDPSWSGAIPITKIFKGERSEFYEKTFHSTEELDTLVSSFIFQK